MGMRPVYVTLAAAGFKLVPMNWRKTPFNVTIRGALPLGGATYSVDYTTDDIRDPVFDAATALWSPVTGMVAAAAAAEATLISPVTCLRVTQTGAGSTKVEIVSAGN